MQQAVFQQAQLQTQVSLEFPGHGTGVEEQAVNDEIYHQEDSLLRMVFSVLANVVGGTLLLYVMFVLPHIIATLLS